MCPTNEADGGAGDPAGRPARLDEAQRRSGATTITNTLGVVVDALQSAQAVVSPNMTAAELGRFRHDLAHAIRELLKVGTLAEQMAVGSLP